MIVNHASWITPFRLEGHAIKGAAYDANRLLCHASLRESPRAIYVHNDPEILDVAATGEYKPIEGEVVYLGHLFDGYGHFLIETLPMLAEVLNDGNRAKKFLFLPFTTTPFQNNEPVPMPATEKIMRTIMAGIAPGRGQGDIIVHCGHHLLCGSFTIAQRPVQIRHAITHPLPYRTILSSVKRITEETKGSSMKTPRVFLSRKEDRIDPEYSRRVEALCKHSGFYVMRPEMHPFEEQVAMMTQAEMVAGFQGSQLHNAIFVSEGATVIEFGDQRRPLQPNINQRLIAGITGSRFEFIPYSPGDFGSVENRFRHIT